MAMGLVWGCYEHVLKLHDDIIAKLCAKKDWIEHVKKVSLMACELCFYKAPKIFMLLLFIHPVVSSSLQPHGLQHARPPCPSPSPGVCPSSCPLYQWYPLILWLPLLLCSQSFPASGTFPMSCLFASDDQNTSASASVLPVSIQGWFL